MPWTPKLRSFGAAGKGTHSSMWEETCRSHQQLGSFTVPWGLQTLPARRKPRPSTPVLPLLPPGIANLLPSSKQQILPGLFNLIHALLTQLTQHLNSVERYRPICCLSSSSRLLMVQTLSARQTCWDPASPQNH